MLINYIKLSIRLMARNPFFTFIKVSGLAIGLAMFFILWQYTQSELRSDQQWKDANKFIDLELSRDGRIIMRNGMKPILPLTPPRSLIKFCCSTLK